MKIRPKSIIKTTTRRKVKFRENAVKLFTGKSLIQYRRDEKKIITRSEDTIL